MGITSCKVYDMLLTQHCGLTIIKEEHLILLDDYFLPGYLLLWQ